MSLPLNVGFILPDGTLIDASGGGGHSRAAMQYINAHPMLLEKSLLLNLNNDAEFLMRFHGAVKVCAYCGVKYIYIPYIHNEYISNIERLYESYGFNVCYFSSGFCDHLAEETMIKLHIKVNAYTPQVVCIKDPTGRKVYCYNPNRDGD